MSAQYAYVYTEFHVYALVDPRTGKQFYVGKTVQQTGRYYAHRTDPMSAAYERMREIEAAGYEADMVILGTFESEEEALEFEFDCIRTTPDLVNRSPGRSPSGREPLCPWKPEFDYVPLADFERPEQLIDEMAPVNHVKGWPKRLPPPETPPVEDVGEEHQDEEDGDAAKTQEPTT